MKERIEELRAEGKTREEVANELGIGMSTLKRLISKYGLGKATSRKDKPSTPQEKLPREVDQNEPPIEWEFTLVEQAQKILGDRAGEDYRGYLLDGQPVNSDTLVRAAGLRYPSDPP